MFVPSGDVRRTNFLVRLLSLTWIEGLSCLLGVALLQTWLTEVSDICLLHSATSVEVGIDHRVIFIESMRKPENSIRCVGCSRGFYQFITKPGAMQRLRHLRNKAFSVRDI